MGLMFAGRGRPTEDQLKFRKRMYLRYEAPYRIECQIIEFPKADRTKTQDPIKLTTIPPVIKTKRARL
jgi:hypothetical protein